MPRVVVDDEEDDEEGMREFEVAEDDGVDSAAQRQGNDEKITGFKKPRDADDDELDEDDLALIEENTGKRIQV